MSQSQEQRRGDVEMMGQQAGGQDRLFYSFNLEAQVPADHLLRGINQSLDLSELRRHLAPFYSHTGRPSNRSGVDDPDADRGLLLWHPLRAVAVRGGASEPGVSLVLPVGPGGCGA